jgi:GNAT superfamily N-acetyltransferase
VDRELWQRCSSAVRRAEAVDMGCAVEDFDRHELVVVPRPASVLYAEYAVMVISFGTGTVISADAPLIPVINADPPAKHFHAFNGTLLSKLAGEVERGGQRPIVRTPALGFTLAEEPRLIGDPAGFTAVERDQDWMRTIRAGAEFHNAIGEPDEDDWFDRLVRSFVMLDEAGEPAAVAAVADDANGCMEIGLDVRRAYRGRGLARPVTLAASRWVLDAGAVPYYTCGAANVRSHLVAESCGYRPLWTITGIARLGPMENQEG